MSSSNYEGKETTLKTKLTAKKVIIGVLKLFFIPIIWPYLRMKQSRKNIKEAYKNTGEPIKQLKKKRDPWAKDAPDMSEFVQVLAHWEIKEREIDGVISGMKVQRFLFTLLGLYGVYLLTSGGLYLRLNGIPLIALGVTFFVVRTWRIQVLQNRQFVFFKDWFSWGMFAWIGKETPFARKATLKSERYHE